MNKDLIILEELKERIDGSISVKSFMFDVQSGKNFLSIFYEDKRFKLELYKLFIERRKCFKCKKNNNDFFSLRTKPCQITPLNYYKILKNDNTFKIVDIPQYFFNQLYEGDLIILNFPSTLEEKDYENLKIVNELLDNECIIEEIKEFIPKIRRSFEVKVKKKDLNGIFVECTNPNDIILLNKEIEKKSKFFFELNKYFIKEYLLTKKYEKIDLGLKPIFIDPRIDYEIIYNNYCNHKKSLHITLCLR